MLKEAGADVQILTRGRGITWLPYAWRKHLWRSLTPGPLRPLSYKVLPPTDLGDIRTARIMADPDKFRRQPPDVQLALLKDVTTPRGAYWLPERVAAVRIITDVRVDGVERAGDKLRVSLSDKTTRTFDAVLLATGYRIDMAKFPLLVRVAAPRGANYAGAVSRAHFRTRDVRQRTLHGWRRGREGTGSHPEVRDRNDERRSASGHVYHQERTALMTELSPDGHDRRPGAIVLGGNFVGLGLVRSLGRRGVPTWVIDTDRKKSIAQFSRYCRRFIATTEPVHEVLLREGRLHELQGWVVFAVADDYVDALSTHFDELSGMYRLTAQAANVTRIALDKRATYAHAAELGIDAPWTCTTSDVSTVDVERIMYPAILKPAVNHRFFPHTNVKR